MTRRAAVAHLGSDPVAGNQRDRVSRHARALLNVLAAGSLTNCAACGPAGSRAGTNCTGGIELPWRATSDPWAILVSEVMLQQTQVARVAGRWESFIAALADA